MTALQARKAIFELMLCAANRKDRFLKHTYGVVLCLRIVQTSKDIAVFPTSWKHTLSLLDICSRSGIEDSTRISSHFAMEFQDIYATCLGSIFVVFIGYQLAAVLAAWRSQIRAAFRKYISQSVIVMRRDGSTDVSVAAALGLLALAAGNVAACIVGVATQRQLVSRLGVMTTVNLIPLYFGGRTGFFISRVCGLSIITYGAIHRWLGRICLLEAAAHIALAVHLSDLYQWKWDVDKAIVSPKLNAYF